MDVPYVASSPNLLILNVFCGFTKGMVKFMQYQHVILHYKFVSEKPAT